MLNSSNDMNFLVGNLGVLNNMPDVPALPIFSDRMVEFLSSLSIKLLRETKARDFVDVTSYAYWIRKASIMKAKEKHYDRKSRLGRGIAFHIAPSNVPVNFAVSMTSSLLAGNGTIIRVSDTPFPQVDLICGAINELLSSEFDDLVPYLCIVRYAHSQEITSALSAICDVRIIWGGNETIDIVRNSPLPPRAVEMAFADRHSIAVINSDEYLQCDPYEIAKGFYTDTYYTDQNACSSPRLIVWIGEKVKEARVRFWDTLAEIVKRDYDLKPIQSVDKYSAMCRFAMDAGEKKTLLSKDNYVVRVEVERLTTELMDYKYGGGYFFEYVAKDLAEIVPVLTKSCQTVSVLGVDKESIKNMILAKGTRGVDRVVELGQTMGLEFIWDGYKMIETMSRFVYSGDYV